MPKPKKSSTPANASAATVGYEAQLWQMADALRGSMDAAEYKHVVPDEIQERRPRLHRARGDTRRAPLPDRGRVRGQPPAR